MEDNEKSPATDFDVEVVQLNSHHCQPSSQGSFWAAFKNEFTLKHLDFDFHCSDVFTTGQWRLPRLVFVAYRLAVAAYAVSIMSMSIVNFNRKESIYPWPAYLTNWSYFVLACHLLWSAIVAVFSFFEWPSVPPSDPLLRGDLPFYLKFNWLLFVIASPAAFVVSIVYFTSIYPKLGIKQLREQDVHRHIMNSVLVILELAISAIPVRLLHFVYLEAFGVIYLTFSAIYWAFDHSRVMYPGVLDWNHPLKSLFVIVVLIVVAVPILQCLLFAAYYLRLCVYNRIYHSNFE